MVTVKDLNRLPGTSGGVGPTEAVSIYTNDQFGRLIGVTPPDGEAAAYTYDLLDQLTSVDMGDQVRTFVYDSLGRLLQSSNPENGLVTFDKYDAAGSVLKKTDAAGVETESMYDPAGRILTEKRLNTTQTLKSFAYDSVSGEDRGASAGQLVTASSFQDQGVTYDPATPVRGVRREMFYEGLQGRLSQEITHLSDGTGSYAFSTGYHHNDFGLLDVVYYPDTGQAGHEPTMASYWWHNGFLSTVNNSEAPGGAFVQSITYNPAGGKRLVKYPNESETEVIPDLLNRPGNIIVRAPDYSTASLQPWDEDELKRRYASIEYPPWVSKTPHEVRRLGQKATDPTWPVPLPSDMVAQIIPDPGGGGGGGGSSPPQIEQWNSGAYAYDGAGNIIGIGSDTFAYDGLSRLVSAQMVELPDPLITTADLRPRVEIT
jgi:YD repeat-containing protein